MRAVGAEALLYGERFAARENARETPQPEWLADLRREALEALKEDLASRMQKEKEAFQVEMEEAKAQQEELRRRAAQCLARG